VKDQSKSKLQQAVIPKSHFNGKNIWILKPVNLNRGQGIHLVSSVEDARQKIQSQAS